MLWKRIKGLFLWHNITMWAMLLAIGEGQHMKPPILIMRINVGHINCFSRELMWVIICFYTSFWCKVTIIFYVRCQSKALMKTYRDLGPTVIPPWLEISVAHANDSHTNLPPALIGLFSIVFGSLCTKCLALKHFRGLLRMASIDVSDCVGETRQHSWSSAHTKPLTSSQSTSTQKAWKRCGKSRVNWCTSLAVSKG